MDYPELRQALEAFRTLFVKNILPPNTINGSEVFLKRMRGSKIWTQTEALRVYNIIKPYELKLAKIGFRFNSVPPVASLQPTVKKKVMKYKGVQKKLIGYDKDSFVITFPYSPNLVAAVRLIPDAKWNMEKRYWNVPLVRLRAVKEFAERFKFEYTQKGLAMIKNIAENYNASYKADKVDLDLPMKLEPYPFQYAGIYYGMKNKCIILGDEMGLGKTPQGIGVALGLDAFPALVICPKSLRRNWQNEWHKFSSKKAIILDRKNITQFPRLFELGVAQVAITNFEGARTLFTKEIHEIEITKGPRKGKTNKRIITHGYEKWFKTCILDEAHEVRNEKTIRFKTIKPVILASEIRLCLTGSPIVKGTGDLASLLELVGRIDDFGGRWKFVRQFNRVKKNDFYGKAMPANLQELNIKLRSLCFIRREKYQVLKELPDKIRQVIKVDIDNRADYDEAFNAFRWWMEENNFDPEKIERAMRAEALVQIGILKQLSAKGKLFAVKEFIQDILDSDEKVVVFCWYLDTARYIGENFENVVFITGDYSDDEVEENKKLFQENDDYKIIVCTYKRGGVGHTLTAASKWISIEEGWTYKDKSQAEDRLHRIGQENAVNCYSFQGIDTIDEAIYDVIMMREQMEKDATGGTTEYETRIVNYIGKQVLKNEPKPEN